MEPRTANRWAAHRGVESVWNERVCRSFADFDAFSSLGFLHTKQYYPSGNVLARWSPSFVEAVVVLAVILAGKSLVGGSPVITRPIRFVLPVIEVVILEL